MKKTLLLMSLVGAAILLLAAAGGPVLRTPLTTETAQGTPSANEVPTWDGANLRWTFSLPPGAVGGEANDGDNLGTGIFIFSGKTGTDLQFNSLAVGTGVTVSSNNNTITFSPTVQYQQTNANLTSVAGGNVDGGWITLGTVADARIASTIARDSEVATAVSGLLNEAAASALYQATNATLRHLSTNSIVGTGRIALESEIASGAADDLGNHTATQNLDMAGNSIVDASTVQVTGSFNVGTVNAGTLNLTNALAGTQVAFADSGNNFTAATVDAAISELATENMSGPNAADAKVHWTQLEAVPDGILTGSQMTNAYTTVLGNGTPVAARTNINFSTSFVVTDNSGDNRTDVTLATVLADIAATGTVPGTLVTEGIDGSNITVGTVGESVIDSAIARLSQVPGASLVYNTTPVGAASANAYTNSPGTNTTFVYEARVIGGGYTNRAAYLLRAAGYRVESAPVLWDDEFLDQAVKTNYTDEALVGTNALWQVAGNNIVLTTWGVSNGEEQTAWRISDLIASVATNGIPGEVGGGDPPGDCDVQYDSVWGTVSSSSSIGESTTRKWHAAKWQASSTGDRCRIEVPLYRVGSPNFTLSFAVYSHNTELNQPGSSLGESAGIDPNTISTTAETVSFDITWTQTSGNYYWVVGKASSVHDASNYVVWNRKASESVMHIMASSDNGANWANQSTTRAGQFISYGAE
jgi:hypothetical protein